MGRDGTSAWYAKTQSPLFDFWHGANMTKLLLSCLAIFRLHTFRYSPTALEQSIEFIRDTIAMRDDANTSTSAGGATTEQCHRGAKNTKNIVGIIGPGSSAVTIQVQNLLQLFNIPQIGYSATSRELSRKDFYKYFLRVVPSDEFQAKLMVDVLLKFNWTYVITINTEGEWNIICYLERMLSHTEQSTQSVTHA